MMDGEQPAEPWIRAYEHDGEPVRKTSYYCFRCGHLWMSKSGSEPKRCPRCHSSRWDVPVKKDTVCKFCGAEYRLTDMEDPCPVCGRMQTEGLTERTMHCNQCDYTWNRRGDAAPKKCPMCHSSEWNLPKMERFMCHQCGHVWRKRTEHPERCPKCKSKIWDQPLKVVRCQRCGHVWKMRNSGSGTSSICPNCRSSKWNEPLLVSKDVSGDTVRYRSVNRPRNQLFRCRSCGTKWYVRTGEVPVCPECGKKPDVHERFESTSMILWTDGRFELTYLVENGCGFVYLWDDGIPVATNYIYELLRELDMKITEVVESVNNGEMNDVLKNWAERMFLHRNDYEVNIDYLMKRLSLDKRDARILAVHFTGMNPDAIARHLGISEESVYLSFDRIMDAYRDSGIVVHDTIFTADPFSMY